MVILSRIARLLPPPRFMTLPSVGIDISESSLKYIQFHHSGRTRTLVRWGDVAIPSGAIDRGKLVTTGGLVKVLRHVHAVCKTPYVRISLPEERAYLFETTIQRGTPEKKVRDLLESRMEENVPLSPQDAFFDYEIVADDSDGQLSHIGVAVYAKQTVLNYYTACIEAKLLPLSFEVEADAIARASLSPEDDGVQMILDLGNMRTGVGIVHNRVLLYTSTIDIGGEQFDAALRAKVGTQEEAALITLKNERGLLQAGEKDDVYEALLPVASALRDEIATRITYWNTRTAGLEERAIEKVILCGGSVNMAGLPEYLTEALGIETERVDVWRNVSSAYDAVPPIARRYSYGYATAIGLALRDDIEKDAYD